MTAPERGTATLAPELARRVGHVARTLGAAGRSSSLYPLEHPAARNPVDRLPAARAIRTVLRAATGEHRMGGARILAESEFRYAVAGALDSDAAAGHPLAHL